MKLRTYKIILFFLTIVIGYWSLILSPKKEFQSEPVNITIHNEGSFIFWKTYFKIINTIKNLMK